MNSLPLICVIILSLMNFSLCASAISSRQLCGSSYTLCAPNGASSKDIPPVGPGLASLYLNLLETIDALGNTDQASDSPAPQEPARRASQMPLTLCCAATTQCLLVTGYHTPCCWDRFTTNFFFADGAYGSITTGNYTTPEGDHANLITGNYELANGNMGNMYQRQTTSEANTRTLATPTPWTSTGIGPAIPASLVGSYLSLSSSAPTFAMNISTLVANATTSGTPSNTGTATVVPSQSHVTVSVTNGVPRADCRRGNCYWAMLSLVTYLCL
ncbi:hypothetical protein PV08_11457 [Exophiala spinifera]|uniref:Uncharacterized protein n=1 Tax=Exophiala spinifera TaxID=91928 RepID=A0A0D2AUU6_9EURO|nr:uncharacterized protein PV08_11457 [Exophiala spinifera]KIW10493.1 hypothetical protein PV08_11457 [Exophiala spinifera]